MESICVQFLCVFLLLAWECLDDRWSRFDAFDWSSVLVSFVTRFQVSCGDSSPSSLHLRLDRWWAGMMISIVWENLVEVAVLPLAFDHLVNRRNNEESSIGYKEFVKCSWLTLSFLDSVLSATITGTWLEAIAVPRKTAFCCFDFWKMPVVSKLSWI